MARSGSALKEIPTGRQILTRDTRGVQPQRRETLFANTVCAAVLVPRAGYFAREWEGRKKAHSVVCRNECALPSPHPWQTGESWRHCLISRYRSRGGNPRAQLPKAHPPICPQRADHPDWLEPSATCIQGRIYAGFVEFSSGARGGI